MNETKIVLKNFMEDIVWEYLDDMLERYPDACRCQVCKYDMVALALNSLKPRYVVHQLGEVYSKLSTLEVQYRADVYAALTRAIATVKEKPRHS